MVSNLPTPSGCGAKQNDDWILCPWQAWNDEKIEIFSVHYFILFLELSISCFLIKIEKGRCYGYYEIKTFVTF
jgi:hypothetical protein